jgi:hypothetical protein
MKLAFFDDFKVGVVAGDPWANTGVANNAGLIARFFTLTVKSDLGKETLYISPVSCWIISHRWFSCTSGPTAMQ